MARGAVFQKIRPRAGFETGGFVNEKLGGLPYNDPTIERHYPRPPRSTKNPRIRRFKIRFPTIFLLANLICRGLVALGRGAVTFFCFRRKSIQGQADPQKNRAFHRSGQNSRVGSGRVGSGQLTRPEQRKLLDVLTPPDPRVFRDVLTRPDPTREISNFLTRPDPTREIWKTS